MGFYLRQLKMQFDILFFASTGISTTPSPSTEGPPTTCYQCGSKDRNIACTVRELLTGRPMACKAGQHFCMIDITIMGGLRTVVKRCVDETSCRKDWLEASSNLTQCVNYDPLGGVRVGIDCHFCCTKDGCNKGYKPQPSELYK